MSEQCQETVYDAIASWGSRPCVRKGIVLEGGKWYCKQHSKAGKESRRAKREGHWTEQKRAEDERIAQRRERDRRADCFPDLLAALEDCYKTIQQGGYHLGDRASRELVKQTLQQAREAIEKANAG